MSRLRKNLPTFVKCALHRLHVQECLHFMPRVQIFRFWTFLNVRIGDVRRNTCHLSRTNLRCVKLLLQFVLWWWNCCVECDCEVIYVCHPFYLCTQVGSALCMRRLIIVCLSCTQVGGGARCMWRSRVFETEMCARRLEVHCACGDHVCLRPSCVVRFHGLCRFIPIPSLYYYSWFYSLFWGSIFFYCLVLMHWTRICCFVRQSMPGVKLDAERYVWQWSVLRVPSVVIE